MRMIPLAAAAVLVGLAPAVMAQDAPSTYPVCSRTVQDECINRSETAVHMPAHMHRTAHHVAAKPHKAVAASKTS